MKLIKDLQRESVIYFYMSWRYLILNVVGLTHVEKSYFDCQACLLHILVYSFFKVLGYSKKLVYSNF